MPSQVTPTSCSCIRLSGIGRAQIASQLRSRASALQFAKPTGWLWWCRDVFNERPVGEEMQMQVGGVGAGPAVELPHGAIIRTTRGDIWVKLFGEDVSKASCHLHYLQAQQHAGCLWHAFLALLVSWLECKLAGVRCRRRPFLKLCLPPAVQCPKTVENFTTHAKNGYYDGVIFHRVIKGFMLQTGDPLGGQLSSSRKSAVRRHSGSSCFHPWSLSVGTEEFCCVHRPLSSAAQRQRLALGCREGFVFSPPY